MEKLKVKQVLQYQLSNGNWVDVGGRQEYFLDFCVTHNAGINTHKEALLVMESGKKLRNDSEDWYSQCRLFDYEENEKMISDQRRIDISEAKRRAKRRAKTKNLIHCNECEQSGYNGQYPFSTIVGSRVCDDCI